MTLTLLHTSPLHVASFNALRDRIAPDAPLTHVVREDWLARAMDGIDPVLAQELQTEITETPGPVLCTCTTLGPVAEQAGALRIDQPMMQAAAQTGGAVMLAYCLHSTLQPSQQLLAREMKRAGNPHSIQTLCLDQHWPLFVAAKRKRFDQALARDLHSATRGNPVAALVLAQASMSGAASLLPLLGLPVFTSPELALKTALNLI